MCPLLPHLVNHKAQGRGLLLESGMAIWTLQYVAVQCFHCRQPIGLWLIRHQPSDISHQPSDISHQPSAISHQPSAISHPGHSLQMVATCCITLLSYFMKNIDYNNFRHVKR
jgi:hypothetical protein